MLKSNTLRAIALAIFAIGLGSALATGPRTTATSKTACCCGTHCKDCCGTKCGCKSGNCAECKKSGCCGQGKTQ